MSSVSFLTPISVAQQNSLLPNSDTDCQLPTYYLFSRRFLPLLNSNPLLSKHNADFGFEKSSLWLSIDENAIEAHVNSQFWCNDAIWAKLQPLQRLMDYAGGVSAMPTLPSG